MVVAGLNADLRSGRGAAVHGGDGGGRGRVHTDDLGLLDAYGKGNKFFFGLSFLVIKQVFSKDLLT